MAGFNSANTDALIRGELWSNQLKDVLYDELMAEGLVRWMSDFPDGNQLTIPTIGQLEVNDYVEDQAVQYSSMDTGEFNFNINTYLSSATYITNKAKQDGFYMSELVSSFVPKQARAIKERLELDVLKEGQPRTGNPAGYQVAANTNAINGAAHRWVGSQTLNTQRVLGPEDFARALFSLKKANVPQNNLIAIVDPSTEYVLNTLTNLVNVSNNPRWEGIISDGIGQGMRFVKNIYGFDVYTSNYLPLCGQGQSGASETISSVASGANAVCNLFFSAASDVRPWVGAWRQMPKVESEYNKDFQREEHVTTARYGLKIFRPENLVTVLSNPAAVG
ncbi:MAG: hypothetical protein LW852_01335 [Sediminibacterium sp.]|jgi:hypothetical protein|nr:hypothetical protein [Sediminibacterium sp.]